jgi:hypothetical protein
MAEEMNGASVPLHQSEHDTHQRGLPRSVRTEESVHPTRLRDEIDAA